MFGIFRKKSKAAPVTWRTPGGKVANLSKLMLEGGAHVMVAGNTRSGKSTLLHGAISDALKLYAPCEASFLLIDPKKTELWRYRKLPHCIGYADDIDTAIDSLVTVREIMNKRYEVMRSASVSADTPKYNGTKIIVVIDELIPLMTSPRKNEFVKLFMLLLSQAGAANIWFIVGTQAPRRDVIPGTLMLYFTLIIGLSMSSATESRCAIGVKGCEALPLHGKALVKYGPERMGADVYPVDLREVQALIEYWNSDACKVRSAA